MNEEKSLIEALEELDSLPTIDYENDPEFIAEFKKGMIVQEILTIMEEKKITKKELSMMIGKSRQYVSKILSEKTNFTVHTLVLISLALGCDLRVSMEDKKFKTKIYCGHEKNVINFSDYHGDQSIGVEKDKLYSKQFNCTLHTKHIKNNHYEKVNDHKRDTADEKQFTNIS